MGIESGVDTGLEVLNKQMTSEQNFKGVLTLKELGIIFSYGFMLFDPSSTFDSIRENVSFLRKIVGDGYAAATFCRMLPYGGTPIRDQLQRGRAPARRPSASRLRVSRSSAQRVPSAAEPNRKTLDT